MPRFEFGVVLGLLTAFTFTVMGLWARVVQKQEGPIRYTVYLVVGPALMALPLWLIWPPEFSWPLVRGVMYVSIPMLVAPFLFASLFHFGEISHVAPIMGGKTLLVTAMAVAVGLEPVDHRIWLAAGILFVALFLTNGRRELLKHPWRIVNPMLLLILVTCIFYGISDLMTRYQMKTYEFSSWDFLTCSWVFRSVIFTAFLIIYSLVRGEPILPRRWINPALTAVTGFVHGLCFVPALKLTNSAVLVNILTSARGIVAVLAIMLLARWKIGDYERPTRGMMAVRLAGALLVIVALYVGLADKLRDQLSAQASAATAGDTATNVEPQPVPSPQQPAETSQAGESSADAAPQAAPAKLDDLYDRAARDLVAGRPLVVTVHVCLCDNDHQGIVKVPNARLADGDDATNNLYWGAMYGVRTFLERRDGWKRLDRQQTEGDVIERCVFRYTAPAGPSWRRRGVQGNVEVVLAANAWRGQRMKKCLAAMAKDLSGDNPQEIPLPGGRTVRGGSDSHLVGFVGHNGLMDYPRAEWPFAASATPDGNSAGDAAAPAIPAPVRGWFALACKSDAYFTSQLSRPRLVRVLTTRQFMAPEAYTLAAAVESLAAGDDRSGVVTAAAKAYARFQKISESAARGVFAD